MKGESVLVNYKKYCTKLIPAENLSRKDYDAIIELERFIDDGIVEQENVVKAFKKANKSKFLRGEVKDFKAGIRWMCNPVHIDNILSGKYDDKPRRVKASFDYSGERERELELEQHQKNQEKLEKIRNDKDHQDWLENYWYKKHPNMRGA